jgi:nitroreductase
MSGNANLTAAIEHALRAPSVHNTQPWRWRIHPNSVELHADWIRHLAWTDPDRRDLVISCGAALHHLRVALAAQQFAVRVDRLPDPENEAHLATITVIPGARDPEAAALLPAIDQRRTERRRMSHRAVPAEAIATLTELARGEDTLVLSVAAPAMRGQLDTALIEAAREQAVAPGYAAELQLWTHRYAGSGDGVPIGSVATLPPGLVHSSPLRQFPSAGLPQPRHPAGTGPPDDAAELLVLATKGDDYLAWLRAGEALSALLLTATRLGLATTPLSQGVEIATVRREIRREILQVTEHPQLIVRVGWPAPGAAELPVTSRRELQSVLLRP